MSKDGKSYSTEDRQEAMGLYLRGHANTDIARKLNKRYNYSMDASTVKRWADKGGWDEYRNQVEIDLIEHTKNTVVGDMQKNMHELEEVRQEFLTSLRDGRAEVRGHEFVKMTEMLSKLQDIETEKQDMVTHLNKCINETLGEMDFDKRTKQKFLRIYIAKLRGDLDG